MPLGAHMSTAGGVDQAVRRGQTVGCELIQIFSKNSNRWAARNFTPKEVELFQTTCQETGISPVLVHSSYLINIGTTDEDMWNKSVAGLIMEIGRCSVLGLTQLIIHPGSHKGAGEDVGLARISQGLNQALEGSDPRVTVLLETTAGQGSNLGYRFEQLAKIVENCYYPERLGVCFDTCHSFAAGYELRTEEGYNATFDEFNRLIGLDRLKAVHLNDSKGKFGGHLDRHEQIGFGQLGLEAFRLLLNDPRMKQLPMVLETPKGPEMQEDVENLYTLRSLVRD